MTPRSAVASASLLLLGTEVPPRDLDCAGLKRAYRRMALLTHPDTRRRHGLPDFLHVKEAFDELNRYLRQAEAMVSRRTAPRTPPHPSTTRAASDASAWYWKGRIPLRSLRLGEYLFYAGIIPWDMLIKAIVEQKTSRPNLGQLACRLGLLSRDQLLFALQHRHRGERLGDALVRFGVVGRATVDQLVAEQKRLQRPLGWHLVRIGCVPMSDIPGLLGKLWRHNLAAQAHGHAQSRN